MNAVDFLIQQHRQLEARLKDLLEASSQEDRQRLLAQCGDHLSVHIASEEEVFYPAVKARRTQDILLESLEEHLSLKRLLADLLALDPCETTFEPKAKVLEEQTRHHHKEEEEHLFPQVRDLLDARELDALGDAMKDLQDRMCHAGEPREAVASQTEKAAELR